MFNGKISTLRDVRSIIKWGVGFKSKKILLFTDLLNHIGFARKGLRNRIAKKLASLSINKELIIKVKAKNHDAYNIKYRLHDYCDYQSLGECLGEGMYRLPDADIKYFIDAGANVGFFSVNMFGRFLIKEAISIEPNPLNLELLNYNLSSFPNCKILPIAVSGQDGSIVFELLGSNSGHIKGSAGNYESTSTVNVISKKISAVVPGHWTMENTLIKIDIEGAEYDVIPEMFASNIYPAIISCEIHDYLRCGGENLVRILSSAGYKISIDGSGESGNVCRQLLCIKQ